MMKKRENGELKDLERGIYIRNENGVLGGGYLKEARGRIDTWEIRMGIIIGAHKAIHIFTTTSHSSNFQSYPHY